MTNSSISVQKYWYPLFVAWFIAFISTLGALFIGEIMGQTPCFLCWHQRIFMFPLAVILGLAAWRNNAEIWVYGLPLAFMGWLIAGYHVLLYYKFIPEPIIPCTQDGPSCSGEGMMLFGVLSIPLLSFIAFTLIAGLLLMVRRRSKP